jgi:hypothetical protein
LAVQELEQEKAEVNGLMAKSTELANLNNSPDRVKGLAGAP